MTSSAFAILGDTSAASMPRQRASRLASEIGFDETRAGQLALVVSELATNIAKHAGQGQLLLRHLRSSEGDGVEVLALDNGPGFSPRALDDGYSTSGTLGAGLGAIRRQADQFEVYTQPAVGTVAVARLWIRPGSRADRPDVATAAVSVAKQGEAVCGDAWDTFEAPHGVRRFIVADGLGHGPLAAEAATAAVHVFRQRPGLAPVDLVSEIHQALRATRGAAVAVASFDATRRVLRFAGVGNILAILITPSARRQHLISHNGTAGHAMRRMQEFTYDVPSDATLVMHSDGLGTHWDPDDYKGVWMRDPALAAGALYRDQTRGRDDSTVVVARLV